jgi:small subunit ribosomal protein S16
MVRIRFRRMGLKGQPTYRIVVADSRNARDGGFIEIIGHHNPRTQPGTDLIDEGRALYWLSVGAQPSDSVKKLMERTGTWDRFQRLRKGETIEALVVEADAAETQAVSPRTKYAAPVAGQGRKSAAAEVTD